MAGQSERRARRQQILEALVSELESSPGARITTARLASVVGVSEAALYRHFPSKAKMFEALIEFAEDSVFGLANRIVAEPTPPVVQVERLMRVVLGFGENNPGIARVLVGDALAGEDERLRVRSAQFLENVEARVRQVLRAAEIASPSAPGVPPSVATSLLMSVLEGRLSRFVRSGFREAPTSGFDREWPVLAAVVPPPPAS